MLASLLTLTMLVGQTADANVKVTYHERLEAAARMPVCFSPNGERIVFFQRIEEEDGERKQVRYIYRTAKSDGTQAETLYETPVDWDDFLNTVTDTAALFAADGRIAVATTDNRRSLRGDNPGKVVPAFIRPGGEVQSVECDYGSSGGFGFAGDDFLFLDTAGSSGEPGYKLKRIADGKTTTLDENEQGTAYCLRISPHGERVVFFAAEHTRGSNVRLRMVELKTKQVVESPAFRSQDATFDGRPQLFWDSAGEGVFCHVSVDQNSKWPFELTHYDFSTKTGYVASPIRNLGASSVLGEHHLAVWHPDVRGCSILELPSKHLLAMPAQNYILGGQGNKAIIADLDRDAIYAATLEIPPPQSEAQDR